MRTHKEISEPINARNPPQKNRRNKKKKKVDLLKPGDEIGNEWKIHEKLGGGGFGEVYRVEALHENFKQYRDSSSENSSLDTYKGGKVSSIDSGISGSLPHRGQCFAVKVESLDARRPMLSMEAAVMRLAAGSPSICRMYAAGKTAKVNYIVMTLQGESLSAKQKQMTSGCFSLSTSLRIICKCLDAVRDFHSAGYLHRDIKPGNFVLRRDDPHEICLVDFGLVRRFVADRSNPESIRPPRPKAPFRGTVRFASPNAHAGIELCRYDDIYSLFYTLIEFLRKPLPWHNLGDRALVYKCKSKTNLQELAVSAGLPNSIAMVWSRSLNDMSYYEKPDYIGLRSVITEWIRANGVHWDDPYDWEPSYKPRFTKSGSNTRRRFQPANETSVPGRRRKPAPTDTDADRGVYVTGTTGRTQKTLAVVDGLATGEVEISATSNGVKKTYCLSRGKDKKLREDQKVTPAPRGLRSPSRGRGKKEKPTSPKVNPHKTHRKSCKHRKAYEFNDTFPTLVREI